MSAVFRPYSASDSLRSDRSATDRLRHRQKVRQAIRENIADIVAEEAIITQDPDRVVKVPIRGIKEYRFVYGKNTPQVAAAGEGEVEKGQVVGKSQAEGPGSGAGDAGDRPGVDYYETDITIEELVEIMFEDLHLPDLERKKLRESLVVHGTRRLGYRRAGIRVHLDKRKSARQRIRRKVAIHGQQSDAETAERRFPFHRDDLRYRRRVPDVTAESNAVVMCIMDTSGSMDAMKKYLARSFFFLLYHFVRTRYRNVELVFISHHTEAREVSEQEFFYKGESGGTMLSSGYGKALEVIQERYHPSLWNIYAFHCSDGENLRTDNPEARKLAQQLCQVCNLFGYGEIKPRASLFGHSSMLDVFKDLDADNFEAVEIKRKEDLWPSFKALLLHERNPEEMMP
ncbi:DUF444 family protein [Rhodospirillaceae bacterium SYSU D60014]|uniref:YeaH/YhbH family protein n=1 Tax=Virgifigura deserti TaxID=2268457 RepID=UPI000E66C929